MRQPWWAGLLLRAFPRDFRRVHGRDVVAFWEAQARERRYRGARGRVRLAAHLSADALVKGSGMRWRRWTGRGSGPGRGDDGGGGETVMRGMTTDVRSAVRGLLRAPLFAATAVVTSGLGIGAATAVFAVVDGVVLRPLPYPEAHRLVLVPGVLEEDRTEDVSWPDFQDWREGASAYLELAGFAESEGTFEWPDGAEAITGALVTRDYFDVMGVQPQLGRGFSAEEDRHGGPDVIVLSHDLWQGRFGGDPDVVGRLVPLDGAQVPVVGVMPPGFRAPYADGRFWAPLQEEELLERVGLPTGTRSLNFVSVVGRLTADTDLAPAEARLVALAARIDEEVGKRADRRAAPALVPLLDDLVGDVRAMLYLVLAAAGLVLLVASANVAGLSLSRAVARTREFAVRTALGAPRGRLLRQFAAESLAVATAAGLVGLAVAAGLLRVLVWAAPPGLPRLEDVGALDGATLGFAVLATCVSAALFGIPPAWRSLRSAPGLGLTGARGASAGRTALRPQEILVSFQVTVAVVLLTAAGLLANSLARLSSVDLGFATDGIVVASVAPGETRYPAPADVDAFYERLLTTVRAIPGVEAASTTYSPPLVGNGFFTTVAPEGFDEESDEPVEAGTVIVRDGYFEANGIPLVRGRPFDRRDGLGQPLAAIVNETLADRLWPGEDPLGKRFVFTGGLRGSADSFDRAFFPDAAYTVVGVAGDVRRARPGQPPGPEYYRPHAQITWGFQYLVVRTSGSVDGLAGALREAVWSVDPTVPVRTVRTLDAHLGEAVAEPRFRTLLLVGFAALTGLLAMVGLYAVMSLAVARRTREMGIRLALGAGATTVVRSVLGRGLRLVGAGLAVGLAVAWTGSRALGAMLYELSPTDPVTYGAVAVVTTAVALLACYGPARRAGRVDPVRSLQEE